MTPGDRTVFTDVAAYPRVLMLNGRTYYYAVLQTDWEDSLFRHADEFPIYSSFETLQVRLASSGIPCLVDALGVVDLDRARAVVAARMGAEEIDAVLVAWNGLEEIAEGVGIPFHFRGELARRSYEKLFWGSNLPSVTPLGEHYVPLWRRSEVAKMTKLLRLGSARVSGALRRAGVHGQPGPDGGCVDD